MYRPEERFFTSTAERREAACPAEDFAAFVLRELPGYMRPYFVRLQKDMRITVTFKHQKVDYRREGYDPSKVADPLYLLDHDEYITLDAETYSAIQDGSRTIR